MRTLLVLLSLVLLVPSVARAQDVKATRDRAKRLYQEGEEHMRAERYDAAIVAFKEAYELAPAPMFLFNLGQAYRKKGDKAQAFAHYEKYLAAEPNGKASAEAKQHLADLRAEAEAEEKRRAEEEERRKAEEERRRLDLRDEARRKALEEREKARDDLAKREHGDGDGDGGSRRDEAPARPGRGLRIAGWTLGAVGVVAIAAGAFFGTEAQSIADELSQTPTNNMWSAELDRKIEDGEAAERNMFIFYGVGGAAVVGSVILLYLGYSEASEASEASAAPKDSITWHPVVAPDAAGVAVSGSW